MKFHDLDTRHFIGGKHVDSPQKFISHSPNDWSIELAEVARGDHKIADSAIETAEKGFIIWSQMTNEVRRDIMHKLANLIEEHIEQIALIESHDMAMRHESLLLRVLPRAARNFRAYADMACDYTMRQWSSNNTHNKVMRMPAGPCCVITPWNAPFMLSSWKCAPALAAGNSVILKPAEWSPLSAAYLSNLIQEAGFPDGAFNIVQGFGEEVGDALVRDKRLKRISFTGSPETARIIGKYAAENIVPFTSELGGKGALVVFADSDIEAAAKKAAGQYDDSGQVCLAGTRLIVEKSIEEEFLHYFHQFTDAHILGDSMTDATTITPMIHPEHVKRVLQFIERARSHGDHMIRGGNLYKEKGLWVTPTLISPKDNHSEIVQREVFGPVLTFQTFHHEDEAVHLANSTEYGLSSIIYTSNHDRAERVGAAIRAGTVWVNCFLIRDLTAPFGGIGISGIGREGGDYALDFQSDLKMLQILDRSTS